MVVTKLCCSELNASLALGAFQNLTEISKTPRLPFAMAVWYNFDVLRGTA